MLSVLQTSPYIIITNEKLECCCIQDTVMFCDRRRDLALESWGYKQREYLEKCCLTINTHNNQLIKFFIKNIAVEVSEGRTHARTRTCTHAHAHTHTHTHTGILLLLTRLHVLARVTNDDTLLINLLFQMNSDCHKCKAMKNTWTIQWLKTAMTAFFAVTHW